MIQTIEYTPDVGFKLNSIAINWLANREIVRKLIGDLPEQQDRVIDLGENQKFESRRDIYANINASNNYLFLNYNSDNALTELEVHWGCRIIVNDVTLDFNSHIRDNVNALSRLNTHCKEIEPGNFLFSNLKLTIADNESLGGEGNNLGYFYASTDIAHLLDDSAQDAYQLPS